MLSLRSLISFRPSTIPICQHSDTLREHASPADAGSGYVYFSLRTQCALRYRARCRAPRTPILAWISLSEADWQAALQYCHLHGIKVTGP